jgi:hypothetical protein
MQLKSKSRLGILGIVGFILLGCSTTKEGLEKRLPGTYKFEAQTLTHGEDILVLNPNHTYVHTYIPRRSREERRQTGRWQIDEGLDLTLYDFVAWELSEWGPRSTEQEYQNPPAHKHGHVHYNQKKQSNIANKPGPGGFLCSNEVKEDQRAD